jgi:hypothetical protein
VTGSIVPGRPFLPKRLVVLFAITAALLTCAALTTSASHARADIPVENIIVQSGEDELLPGANPTVVYLNESNEIRLENPGLSVPLPPGCTPVGGTDRRTVCIGEGGKETIDGTPVGKGVTILGGNRYGVVGLPSLEHLIDEAVTILMARHEIDNREMVLKYARGEIRAYLYARINEILDKRLYGEPMTPQELETYRSVAAFFTAEEQRIGREIHRQYLAWKSDPCGWVPPKPPPGSNLPVVPNRTASTAACVTPHLQANLWRITNNTPTVDEFKHWAVYADPTIPVLLTGDPDHVHEMRSMVTATIALSSLGAAAGAGLTAGAIVGSSIGITKAFISTVVGTVGLVLKNAAAANLIALGTATAASSASVVVITAAIIAVASIQFAEDTAIPEEINRIAEEADSLTDRLGIETHRPDYADLDFETREQPANQEQVPWVKSEEFQTSLLANVIGWTTFDVVSGQYLNDPVDGYNSVPATTDAKFKVNGVDNVGYLELRSPTGTPDFAGRATDAYRVHLKDGWLMTSSRNPNNGQWRQPVPRLTLPFIQADGTNGILSIVRVDDTRKFQVTTVPGGDGEATAELLDNVTFKLPSGTNAIAAFQPKPRRIPRVGVLPTVDGEMLPGHLLTFRSNPTDDTYDGDLDIGWTVERFNDDGEVVETIVENNVVAFQKRLSAPGPYRATVAFSLVSGGDIYEGSGSVDFRVEIPTPLIDGEVRIHPDDPTQRHLAIEIEQQSPGAVFNVEVEWGSDANGNPVTRSYTVDCVHLEPEPACQTGFWPNGVAPANPNWSTRWRVPERYRPGDGNQHVRRHHVRPSRGFRHAVRQHSAIREPGPACGNTGRGRNVRRPDRDSRAAGGIPGGRSGHPAAFLRDDRRQPARFVATGPQPDRAGQDGADHRRQGGSRRHRPIFSADSGRRPPSRRWPRTAAVVAQSRCSCRRFGSPCVPRSAARHSRSADDRLQTQLPGHPGRSGTHGHRPRSGAVSRHRDLPGEAVRHGRPHRGMRWRATVPVAGSDPRRPTDRGGLARVG